MLGWVKNIEKDTLKNKNFREVVFTGKHAQLVLMSLLPGEEIGWESHAKVDQFFRLEQGKVRLDLGTKMGVAKESHEAKNAWAFVVPAGTFHNVTNIGKEPVRLYTVYSPPNHPANRVQKTKAEADAAE